MDLPKPQKLCLEAQLMQFLDISHMETIHRQIQRWLNKLKVPQTEGILEVDLIDTWPKFIRTLCDLIKLL